MTIIPVRHAKKLYLPLLLLADEQEDMIDKYLERGDMYVLDDEGIKAECVVTDEGCGILELKSIAVCPESQRKGYGKRHSAQGHGLSAQTYLTPHTIKAKQKGLKLSFQAFLPGGDKRDRTADLLNAIVRVFKFRTNNHT